MRSFIVYPTKKKSQKIANKLRRLQTLESRDLPNNNDFSKCHKKETIQAFCLYLLTENSSLPFYIILNLKKPSVLCLLYDILIVRLSINGINKKHQKELNIQFSWMLGKILSCPTCEG